MDRSEKIFLAGSTGLIGSAVKRALEERGYENMVHPAHSELDLRDSGDSEELFSREKPDCVILAAARSGGIKANNRFPADFIFDNLMIQANVINLSYRYQVKKLMFLVSSCVYPKYCNQPMQEDYILTGSLEPSNEPFAVAKLAGLKMCQSYNRQYGTRFMTIIPANVYGANDRFNDDGHVLAGLINRFHQAKCRGDSIVKVWGSGQPVREFIYSDDVADACVYFIENDTIFDWINVGTGKETSIKELAEIIREIIGFTGDLEFDTTRPDGNPKRQLDSSKMMRLGWKPKVSLESGIRMTYEWYKSQLSLS